MFFLNGKRFHLFSGKKSAALHLVMDKNLSKSVTPVFGREWLTGLDRGNSLGFSGASLGHSLESMGMK
jgi:hypothetical protein